jgi:Raf kinase inhibitor-like YbhB/YbcL family protein
MHLRSDSFRPYEFLDPRLAMGKWDPQTNATVAGNRNPHLAWSDAPGATRSFALLAWDPEVPTRPDDVNQVGRKVPLDLPRADFFHWVLADLPAHLREIREGTHAEGMTPNGKPPGASPSGGLQGLNDYTGWFAGDANLKGDYAGYDGPWPPFNDQRIHAYNFVVYALDVVSLGLSGRFTGHDVRQAMRGHVLAEARITGLYAIDPDVRRAYKEQLIARGW